MPDYPSRVAEKIVVRLPDGMRARLAEVAKANKRSVNAEVVARLEMSLSNPFAGESLSTSPQYRAALQSAVQTLQGLLSTIEGSPSE